MFNSIIFCACPKIEIIFPFDYIGGGGSPVLFRTANLLLFNLSFHCFDFIIKFKQITHLIHHYWTIIGL